MSEPVTPESAALPSITSDDLWTSDSQRADSNTDVELAPDEPPAPATPDPEPPALEAAPEKPKGSGKPRNDPAARVQQATAREAAAKEEARTHRERADRLEAELAAARRPTTTNAAPAQTTQRPTADGRPTWSAFEAKIGTAFESWGDAVDAYNDARDSWKDEQHAWSALNDEMERAKGSDPEFAKVLAENAALEVSGVMRYAIRDSKQRLDIIRFLGTHPEICGQLASESFGSGRDAVPVMRRYLESQVTAGAVARPDSAPVVQPSTATPPVNRVGGSANAIAVNPDDLEFGPEFIRQENARDKRRQESNRW